MLRIELKELFLHIFLSLFIASIILCTNYYGRSLKTTAIEKLDINESTDYCLESSGGSIYNYNAKLFTTMFGLLVYNGPRKIIQSNMKPSECFAFHGEQASVTIKLLGPVFIEAISLEHISQELLPNENLLNAPKEFSVYVIDNNLTKCMEN